MLTSARHAEILALARRDGQVLADDLARQFSVSVQTIRKDLNLLSARGALRRSHGGALFPSSIENVEYEARRRIAAAAKQAIGRAAAGIIGSDAALFINVGTTTEAVAEALGDHSGLMVITNNINVANRLRTSARNEVIIAGGVVRPADGAIVGEAAVDFIRQFKVDFAVIGASAVDADGALLDFDLREVKVAQAIIENARHVILVADATKFVRSAPVRIGHVSQVTSFVTDRAPDGLRQLCETAGVDLIETRKS